MHLKILSKYKGVSIEKEKMQIIYRIELMSKKLKYS